MFGEVDGDEDNINEGNTKFKTGDVPIKERQGKALKIRTSRASRIYTAHGIEGLKSE